MKIKTEQHYSDHWLAFDETTYDGPGSAIGTGHTEAEAISDLREQIKEEMRGDYECDAMRG
jgi:hypothetical protein